MDENASEELEETFATLDELVAAVDSYAEYNPDTMKRTVYEWEDECEISYTWGNFGMAFFAERIEKQGWRVE